MSMIPADLSAIHSASAMPLGTVRRLPRAIGWLSAAMVSGAVWLAAIEAIRLVF